MLQVTVIDLSDTSPAVVTGLTRDDDSRTVVFFVSDFAAVGIRECIDRGVDFRVDVPEHSVLTKVQFHGAFRA